MTTAEGGPKEGHGGRGAQWAVPGGRLRIDVDGLPVDANGPPLVLVGATPARVLSSSSRHLHIAVPPEAAGGLTDITVGPSARLVGQLQVARSIATGVHQVDNPAFDGLGRLYLTHSGSRGVKVPVPIYRLRQDGVRDPVPVELPNPTSIALGPDGALYVSSRFEGQVYRLTADDQTEVYASDLGVATGLAFGRDGTLYVGDRSGTIFKVSRDRHVETFATLPSSVAAFHLAIGPDDCLYIAAPTLASHDPIYRVTPDRLVDVVCDGFGRPQGLAFDSDGYLYVADALAGASAIYRLDVSATTPSPEQLFTTPMVIGLAFDPEGGLVLASNETVWRLDVPLRPLVLAR
ncbi:MAG: SMP-30/gluconolactonase/LRE family protein [Acidobacteriota bacterium]